MKKILVTGCAGFIGARFCSYVRDLNPEIHIVGIDNFFNSNKDTIHNGIEFIEGDIRDKELLISLFSKHVFDAVFHFAAIAQMQFCQDNPVEAFDVNVRGTLTILDVLAGQGRQNKARNEGHGDQQNEGQNDSETQTKLIFSSSAAIYGNTEKIPVSESDPKTPAGFYGLHKWQCEQLIEQYVLHKGVDAVSLRYFNVFGPGQKGDSAYATIIAKWFDSLHNQSHINSEKPTPPTVRIDGDGTQSRDFIFIDSVIDANLLAFAKGKAGEAYNIASGQEYNLLELKELFEKIMGFELAIDWKEARAGDIKRSLASVDKATKELGFDRRGDIEEELRQTAEWWSL